MSFLTSAALLFPLVLGALALLLMAELAIGGQAHFHRVLRPRMLGAALLYMAMLGAATAWT